ncbi:MAG: sigma-54 dependent transcriptional regulator [Spirochaetaceae bacterium]|jgi:two-component system response regulator AtoC|nr:sigma-54 dependent transcriptional regulator [Spirochaetaceae bacterium]
MRVLIVDDEGHIRESLGKYLALEKIEARGFETAEEARERLEQEVFDAAVLDLRLPGMSGQELLLWMRQQGLTTPVIMISAHGQIADAVQALKTGAQDYLVKPFDPAELVIRLRSLVENRRRENRIETEERRRGREGGLIGESGVMRELGERIRKIAASEVTVLITGESGSGKEAVAREIHRRGEHRDEPFAAVNIGGIHEGLMESELFGHEKGAFTGAAGRRLGLFEIAGRGTIFLDEIGEMPQALQVKLLRVLQERKIRRLGGTGDIPVNARIISATNRDLETMVKSGGFREDLYFRLNVFRLIVPPLRDRREDIPPLAEHLLRALGSRMGLAPRKLSGEALEKLRRYSFPGNVRELENILERALIYGEGNVIGAGDIELHRAAGLGGPEPAETAPEGAGYSSSGEDAATAGRIFGGGSSSGNTGGASAPRPLESWEKEAVLEALGRCNGNRTKAAKELGITRKTLLNKVKAYGIIVKKP